MDSHSSASRGNIRLMTLPESPDFSAVSCANCGAEPAVHRRLAKTRVVHPGRLHGRELTAGLCGHCGLVFLNPRPTAAALKFFYESEYYSTKTTTLESRLAASAWQKEILYDWLISHLPPPRGAAILDIGCGYGDWLRHFDPSNRKIGIEQSPQAAECARHMFAVDVRPCDFMANGLGTGAFDLITGLAIIEHFVDPLAALVEANRLLKPGGHLFLQTPDLLGLTARRGLERYIKLVHTFYYSRNTLSSLLRKAGFEIVASRSRPPVLSTSDWLRPGNAWEGELDVLGRKSETVSLEAARSRPASGDDPDLVQGTVQRAIERDSLYGRLWRFYALPVIGRLANHSVRLGFALTGRDTRKRDVHARQLDWLRNVATPSMGSTDPI